MWVRPDAPADQSTVASRIAQINDELARYETIKRFFIADAPLSVETGTLTSSLKLRRKIVYQHLRDKFEALYA